jgi:hypothetical protein
MVDDQVSELLHCTGFVAERAMNDVVDRILNDDQLIRPFDAKLVKALRWKIAGYIGSLMSRGSEIQSNSRYTAWHICKSCMRVATGTPVVSAVGPALRPIGRSQSPHTLGSSAAFLNSGIKYLVGSMCSDENPIVNPA